MSKKKIVLHIGQTKTGTTSIQSFLHANQKNLERSNIYYARRPDQATSHRYLFHLINASIPKLSNTDLGRRHFLMLKEAFRDNSWDHIDEYWKYFKDNLFQGSCNISIISEELLWELGRFEHASKQDMIKLLAQQLHQVVLPENITIIAAVRHHAEWLESWHNQMVKDQGNQIKIRPFLEREISHGSLRYRQNLCDWLSCFPKARFRVVDFKTSLVTARPIGIMFLQESGLLDCLSLESMVNLVYPERLQESIHPLLHAYIIRNKPPISDLLQYKAALKKANYFIGAMTKVLDLNYSYTMITPPILKICTDIYSKDDLSDFGVAELKCSLQKRRQVPKVIPIEILEYLNKIFKASH